MTEAQPQLTSLQEPSTDRTQPAASSFAGRLETLIGSPYWPLGSSFIKLLLGGTPTSKDDDPAVTQADQSAPNQSNQMEIDLDGLPIESDGDPSDREEEQLDPNRDEDDDDDDAHNLEELLVKPNMSDNGNSASKPSLSDRLTEPSARQQRSFADKSYRDYDYRQPTRLPFSSITRNTNIHIKGLANLKRSHPASEPWRTSSNLIECNSKLHPWGSKRPNSIPTGPQALSSSHKRARLSVLSQQNSESTKWVRDRYQESDEQYEDRRVSESSHSHRYDSHQQSEHYKKKSLDVPTSNASETHSQASRATPWKKLGIQDGPAKKNRNTTEDLYEEVADRQRRWMQEFKQYDVEQTALTHSVSSRLCSNRRSPSRHSLESDRDYYSLTPLAPDVEAAVHRAVFSWINRSIAEALFRLGLWLEEKRIWAPNEWGSIRVDQLEQVVDLTFERGLSYLLRTCHSAEFMDLLQKPIQSGIFLIHKDPQNDAWYIRFCKDYGPIGLLYRPIIKGCRRHLTDSYTQQPIQAGKFLRQYIMCHPDEDELLYLFQDDKDPMGCLRRAEKAGVVELADHPFRQGPIGKRRGTVNRKWHNKISTENQYIRLKPYWLSNKETVGNPLESSPTTTAQTCNTAQLDADDSPPHSTRKDKKKAVSDSTEKEESGELLPAIDRRNSDNTSVSVNTTCTNTDAGNEQLDRPLVDDQGEDPHSHKTHDIEILQPTSHHRSHSSNVDDLVQSLIDKLRHDTPRRKRD